MAPAPRLSGLQHHVFSLYRKVLREALKKDQQLHASGKETLATSFVSLLQDGTHAGTSTSFASKEYKLKAHSVKRTDFKRIEYMIRKGEKQLKLLQMPGVRVVSGSGNFPSNAEPKSA
mmetsp:Transcript_17980/g.23242  ORF Transcript_17980/g.23242 Transcript_17980/m.23242 type:complete len:118 (-) Transcript_17980:403-756(-)